MSVQEIVESVRETMLRHPDEAIVEEGFSEEEFDFHYRGFNLGMFSLGVIAGSQLVEHGPINVEPGAVEREQIRVGATNPFESVPETLGVEMSELSHGLMELFPMPDGFEDIPDVAMGLIVGKSLVS